MKALVLPRPQSIEYQKTMTYKWVLTHDDKNGSQVPVCGIRGASLQVNGPVRLYGSNDDVTFVPLMDIEKAGIYGIPLTVRAICPRAEPARGATIEVVLFLAIN